MILCVSIHDVLIISEKKILNFDCFWSRKKNQKLSQTTWINHQKRIIVGSFLRAYSPKPLWWNVINEKNWKKGLSLTHPSTRKVWERAEIAMRIEKKTLCIYSLDILYEKLGFVTEAPEQTEEKSYCSRKNMAKAIMQIFSQWYLRFRTNNIFSSLHLYCFCWHMCGVIWQTIPNIGKITVNCGEEKKNGWNSAKNHLCAKAQSERERKKEHYLITNIFSTHVRFIWHLCIFKK